MNDKSSSSVLMGICDVLRIAPTGRKILEVLIQKKKKLPIGKIISLVGRSERAVRAHLKDLLNLGLVCREAHVTKHKRVAHLYFTPAIDDMIKSTKKVILERLRDLEKSPMLDIGK
jgi:predicted transcriptional regulator